MAGEARSEAFMLGTATVMLGLPADLLNMTPATHSIGLVKNFVLNADASFTELTQGVKNQVVFSVKTGNKIMAQMEAYEYTAKNLSYALGLEGSTAGDTITTSTSVVTDNANTTTSFKLVSSASLSVGDYISLQVGTQDNVLVRKISAIASPVITVDIALPTVPAAGTTVTKQNVVPLGSNDDGQILAACIVGTIADGTEVTVWLPKIKVTKGFSLAFQTDNFQNMPLEFSVYDLVATDEHYARFTAEGSASALLFTRK